MKLTQAKYSDVTFEGESLKLKHLTTREFSQFKTTYETTPVEACDAICIASIEGLNAENIGDVPLSTRNELLKLILKTNGLDAVSEETHVKN